jgi:hypothetical protein
MYLGGKAGRAIGEGIGESMVDDGSDQPQKLRYTGTMLGGLEIPPKRQTGGIGTASAQQTDQVITHEQATIGTAGNTQQQQGDGMEAPPKQSEKPQNTRYTGTMLGGVEIPSKQSASQAEKPEQTASGTAGITREWPGSSIIIPPMQANSQTEKPEQTALGTAGKTVQWPTDKMEISVVQPASQILIPESVLPPQITRNETPIAPPAKAEIEGQASIDVNVNLSGERPSAQVNVKNNNMPFMKFNSGNAPYARMTAL